MKQFFKKKIKESLGSLGIEILRSNRRLVSLKSSNGNQGNVLLSYVIDPFVLPPGTPVPNTHTNHWESWKIAETFLNLGHNVDVVHYKNKTFIPKKYYSIFIGARSNFQRIAGLLNHDCLKVVHLTTAHWLFSNSACYRRCLELQQRRGITLKSFKWVDSNWAIECADCATILGNEFTIGTYSYAKKPIHPIPISTCAVYPWSEEKNYEACRKRFLWFGGTGLVHKGLDLVLETFSKMPDYRLTVCGPIEEEKAFANAFHRELYATPNIQTIGWIDVTSPEFAEIIEKNIGIVYPSCSEGQCGAVVNCLHGGLIPIVSSQTGVNVDEFGIVLKDCSIDEIGRALKKVSSLRVVDLRGMSRKAWEYARAKHTREHFAREYEIIAKRFIEKCSAIRTN